ncbi:26386_t:CDS:2, partial [Racocetra persica]
QKLSEETINFITASTNNIDFDQNNQQSVSNTLSIEEDLLTEQEALQSISIQSYNIENTEDTKDLWEIIEETVIAS